MCAAVMRLWTSVYALAGGDCAFIDLTQAQFYPHEHNVFCSHFYRCKSVGKPGATLEAVMQISWFMFCFRVTCLWRSDGEPVKG